MNVKFYKELKYKSSTNKLIKLVLDDNGCIIEALYWNILNEEWEEMWQLQFDSDYLFQRINDPTRYQEITNYDAFVEIL